MNENLPSYVVLVSQGTGKNPGQPIFSRLWGSGFLPSSHQGVQFRSGEDPVLFLNDPEGMTRSDRHAMLDDLGQLNELRHNVLGDPEILARISQYEMAFRMQASTRNPPASNPPTWCQASSPDPALEEFPWIEQIPAIERLFDGAVDIE